MKKNVLCCVLTVAVILLLFPTAFAEDYLNANDLDVTELSASVKVDDTFSITATSEKMVLIQKCDAVMSPDGEIFNQRINLKGSGSKTYRSILFKTDGKTQLKIYLKSSSKTDTRLLQILAVDDDSVIGNASATPSDGNGADVVTVSIPKAGTYCLTSKSGGIYVYGIDCGD